MNQSQVTDQYLALPRPAQEAICKRAIKHLPCKFCRAAVGQGCTIGMPPYAKESRLDWFAHCGRWMEYMMNEDILDMLAPPPPASNDISDML